MPISIGVYTAKIRVLHIPTGMFHEIELRELIDMGCNSVQRCPKELQSDENGCSKCPWALDNNFDEIQYTVDIV